MAHQPSSARSLQQLTVPTFQGTSLQRLKPLKPPTKKKDIPIKASSPCHTTPAHPRILLFMAIQKRRTAHSGATVASASPGVSRPPPPRPPVCAGPGSAQHGGRLPVAVELFGAALQRRLRDTGRPGPGRHSGSPGGEVLGR